jgi:2-aminoethylphosphonate aminotransferase
MIKTAVIVAGGLGSRLGERTKEMPKGFLELEGLSLIKRSVDTLKECGIEKIYIGTGYLNTYYDAFASAQENIYTIKSDKYETTSSMYTLYNMRHQVKEDFLLLESDLLYEKKAILTLLEDPREDVILASSWTKSEDEVFIQTDKDQNLLGMSKNEMDLDSPMGELVGISKVSIKRYELMNQLFESLGNMKIDYEYIFVESSKKEKLPVKRIENLIWCEIDDERQLNRALTKILPGIKQRGASTMKIKRNVLLNPGPATTTDTVKMAQVVADICPREQEFGDLMGFVSRELTQIVGSPENYASILFGCSGTGAVEAVLSSVIPRDKKVVIVNNGAYGKRMCQISDALGIDYVEFKSSSITPLNIADLEKCIEEAGTVSHLAAIHHETTTGLLNDLDLLGDLAKRQDIELIIDAMSSYAALPIDMEKQGIHYLCASSNKNIQGMAGVGFVIASKESLDTLKAVQSRSYYFDLYAQYQNYLNSHQMRFTPPVQTLYALKQAIIEAKAEGIPARYERYSKSWKTLTDSLKEMGLTYLVDDKNHSRIITSIHIPEGVDFNELHDFFYERDITIYPGKVEEFNTFRVANIGTVDFRDIENFVILLKKFLKRS